MPKKPASEKQIESFVHDDASRRNIPPAEYQTMVRNQEKTPLQVAYERRNPDLDPQLIWRGKDLLDDSPLVVNAPPLYIQEKIHPKVLIDNLKRRSKQGGSGDAEQIDLFSAFNGLPSEEAKTEFYQHDQNWSNRMILGDSLQVMASLAEREGLRGKVQCIYFDPPYGIKFNSNFQWSTTSRDVKDGRSDNITREPEQVKAFRDTWRDGIHSYLSYFRDRLVIARDLLTDSGSIFVQIGDDNVHRIRAVMDEVFGDGNAITEIVVKKKGSQKSSLMDPVNDFILWYSKSKRADKKTKFRTLYEERMLDSETVDEFSRIELPNGDIINLKNFTDANGEKLDFRAYPRRIEQQFPGGRLFRAWPITNGGERSSQMDGVNFKGVVTHPPKGRCWSHTSKQPASGLSGMMRNLAAGRLVRSRTSLDFKRYLQDFPYKGISNWWDGLGGAPDQVYVVQTNERIIERCILMVTDPGDLVLDPTCGSGTTATVAEQWGRRWITIDTSRVALALARTRMMGARYPFYLLSDSCEGKDKEAEVTRTVPIAQPVQGKIRHGFVYRRCAYITSGSIANNAEIDVIWSKWLVDLEQIREKLNASLLEDWQEWEIPRESLDHWSDATKALHADWWRARISRQREIDESIAAKAESEYLYDKPYEDKKKVRVAGPFTVESLSPHRTMIVNDDDSLIDPHKQGATAEGATDFAQMVLGTLRVAGVQQAHKEDRISFESLNGWPGSYIAGKGSYRDADGVLITAGIFIGPEFGTVSRVDLVEAARECADAGLDVLISCAFNYEAQSTEFDKLGPLPVLKARMNADLHMQPDLKNTGKGNLFVIFGEPDIDILDVSDTQILVKINGVDVFDPSTGEVRSDEPATIACWFIDSDYNGESFFVRQAYFLGQNDPYKSLKTSLKAEIDADAWESLNSDTSIPFAKPSTGRIAVKVINHLGDEVMKVYRVA
ncbi:site-specific DNA-methyltransferase [Cyanobium sp. ATX 6E8]|uniref:site-specific DNA-methyltransferase n=1 Tax=Cyanobium sp. ATX 6E8 TaxID=2823701 RepID=UPI0020CD7546|nr:site-specific DNA-methyltransferase [Cyanobium sp. ATX 6E8]MCP9942441.1 site-specific DNA-methyltransferase [Cyanobium sp. ATX 6E8]